MASEIRRGWRGWPAVWLLPTVAAAFAGGFLCAGGQLVWILCLLCSVGCGVFAARRMRRVEKRVRYVIESTLSGDFSYKFPTAGVSDDEKEINGQLNRIVARFEELNTESGRNDAFLKRVINLSDTGMAVADADGNVILHNEAVLRLLDRPALTHVCQLPAPGGTGLVVKRSELTVREKGFSVYTLSDFSRQMQAVEVESWEKLTRVLTHEIMNSLTPVRSIAETMSGKLAEKEKPSESEIEGAFATISSSSGALMQFVRNFREFNRLPEPKMRVFYLKPLLESCLRMGEEYADGREVSMSVSCFPPDVMVYTDETLLSRVILNIVKNAVEAKPSAVRIEADLRADETVEIRISNDGEPIAEETAGHIFIPFFTTRESGSGIGLSLSRRIITHLGGTLSFSTKPVTCFTIRI